MRAVVLMALLGLAGCVEPPRPVSMFSPQPRAQWQLDMDANQVKLDALLAKSKADLAEQQRRQAEEQKAAEPRLKAAQTAHGTCMRRTVDQLATRSAEAPDFVATAVQGICRATERELFDAIAATGGRGHSPGFQDNVRRQFQDWLIGEVVQVRIASSGAPQSVPRPAPKPAPVQTDI
jgi:hypothetical protein